jgi:hypothetical protein
MTMMRKRYALALAAALCGLLGLVPAGRAGDGTCCPTACPAACGHSVCCPTTDTKTVEKRYYSDCTEEFCLPCSVLGMITHQCSCSKVMTRRDMILKVRKHDVCVKKCVPVTPACQTPCAPTGCAAAPATITIVHPGSPVVQTSAQTPVWPAAGTVIISRPTPMPAGR